MPNYSRNMLVIAVNTAVAYQQLTFKSSLIMEAARTSETSVDNHFTRQYNPEDSSEQHLSSRRHF
jgi:hypothetical protein